MKIIQGHTGKATIRIKKERKELLSKYATASVFLYGVLSVDEFVDVFNHYEEIKTDSNETTLALQRFTKTNDVEYSIFEGMISGPAFQPDFDEYEEVVTSIRADQKRKPRYLPEKEEFLRYETGYYFEPEKPYSDLKTYILKNCLTLRGEGLHGVDGDLMDLREMVHNGYDLGECLRYFINSDYIFNDIDDVDRFTGLLVNAINNTRIYENNGFSPVQISEQFKRPGLKLLSKEPFNTQSLPKVGRNDPCPCGSGLKYKKCHGR
ncbi:MAG: SEC-C domain-containing protein [Synergistaceae bacterium]|nr:SEC-C domain-containing protein [Synergistaceae bacterium]